MICSCASVTSGISLLANSCHLGRLSSRLRVVRRIQMSPQHHAGTMQLRLRGAGRNLQQVRYLLVLVALYVVQHENLPGSVRQFRQRRLEVHGQVSRTSGSRREHLENVLTVVVPLAPGRLGPESLDHDVDGEPVKPGAEGRVAAKCGELLPDTDENVLRQF